MSLRETIRGLIGLRSRRRRRVHRHGNTDPRDGSNSRTNSRVPDDTRPMKKARSASWDVPLTTSEYRKLLKGFRPQSMDDKWVVYADKPDARGNTVVHFSRPISHVDQIRLTITGCETATTKAKITKITWVKHIEDFSQEPKMTAVNLCRNLMDLELRLGH